MSAPVRAWIELEHYHDVTSWAEDHARGLLPSRTPFGLDEISGFGVEPVFATPPTGRRYRRVAEVFRHRSADIDWVQFAATAGSRERRRCDVAMAWVEANGIPLATTRRVLGGPPVVMGIELLCDARLSPRYRSLAGRAMSASAAVFAQSRAMIRSLHDDWNVPADRLHFVPFGVDGDWFRPGAAPVIPGRVVSLGNDAMRDFGTVSRAMASVVADHPDATLEIATVRDIPVAGPWVTLRRGQLGPARPTFYGSAAVVAIATRPNLRGSGMSALLEAMACGRPYVITAGPALEGYVADGVDGFVVPPDDPDAMARAIGALLDDPDRADEMGRAGRERLTRTLTTTPQAEALAAVLRRVI